MYAGSLVLRWLTLAAALTAGMMGGCRKQPAQAQNAPPPPPPAVTVAHPIEHEVIEWDEYTGRLQAVETVEVRARVSGFIESTHFEEGSLVEKGDLLFVIDPRPFEVELEKAKADLASAEAQREYAKSVQRRLEEARTGSAVSGIELENSRRDVLEAEANVSSAEAGVRDARLNLEWTRVTAPISGRVSSRYVTPGNLINGGPGEATLLTTITSIDPIECTIDADEQSVLKYQRLSREGKRVSARDTPIPCYLQLADEEGFPHKGMITFVDNRLDPETGTIRAKATFDNPNGWLVPGFYAKVRIPGSGRYTATLVPNSAVGTDQAQRFVMVVNDQNQVERRNVKLGSLFGGLRAIESGVSTDDRVVINGLQRAQPGAAVTPQPGEISAELLDKLQVFAPPAAVPPQGKAAVTCKTGSAVKSGGGL